MDEKLLKTFFAVLFSMIELAVLSNDWLKLFDQNVQLKIFYL